MVERAVTEILEDARLTLETARFGLDDLLGEDPRRRLAGLRNLIVFGRAVTNVIQNLKSKVEGFEDWYGPVQDGMRADPVMAHFYKLRSEILKEGRLNVSNATHIEYLGPAEMQRLMQDPPPGAESFFLGDQLGGNGWRVRLPDGTIENYYVAIPSDIKVTNHFIFPTDLEPGQQHQSVQELAQHYYDALVRVLAEARARFG